MAEILEIIMLVCFGLSWPISVYKSIKAHTAKGKSPLFILLILTGYIAGISAKIMTGSVSFVLAVYFLNFIIVAVDLGVYFYNRTLDKKRLSAETALKSDSAQQQPCKA